MLQSLLLLAIGLLIGAFLDGLAKYMGESITDSMFAEASTEDGDGSGEDLTWETPDDEPPNGDSPGSGGPNENDGGESARPESENPTDDSRLEKLERERDELVKKLAKTDDPQQRESLQELITDYQIAIELERTGQSETLQRLWDENSAPEKGTRRFEGLAIAGRLAVGAGEIDGVKVYLRDTETGEVYRYSGVGGGAGLGGFIGFTFTPFEVDLADPKDFTNIAVNVGGVIALGAGGGTGGTVGTNPDGDMSGDMEFSFALGVGASLGGGGTYSKYNGRYDSFATDWLLDLFWR